MQAKPKNLTTVQKLQINTIKSNIFCNFRKLKFCELQKSAIATLIAQVNTALIFNETSEFLIFVYVRSWSDTLFPADCLTAPTINTSCCTHIPPPLTRRPNTQTTEMAFTLYLHRMSTGRFMLQEIITLLYVSPLWVLILKIQVPKDDNTSKGSSILCPKKGMAIFIFYIACHWPCTLLLQLIFFVATKHQFRAENH